MTHRLIRDFELITDATIIQGIQHWINHVDLARDELQGDKICPYAAAARNNVIVAKAPYPDLFQITEDFVMIIFVADDKISLESLQRYATALSLSNRGLVFLTDHHSQPTHMSGVQTNNGQVNAIVCQPASKLLAARKHLKQTNYYSHWSQEEWQQLSHARNAPQIKKP